MTKSFLHGRTESVRTVQPESVHFVKVRWSNRGAWINMTVRMSPR
jgi:carnitine O-acetyltransferase